MDRPSYFCGMNYRFALISILAISFVSGCNRSSNSPNANADRSALKKLSGTWYFARMEGEGYPLSTITFVNDSILLDDTNRLKYQIKQDSITIDFVTQEGAISPVTHQFKPVSDSLILIDQDGHEYYCRTEFAWDNNKLGSQIVGTWITFVGHESGMVIEKGVIRLQYADSVHVVRASFRGNILTILDRGSQLFDTIYVPAIDTLVFHSEHGVDTLFRGEGDA